ncbi:hypothetical protein BYT27DRAFT_7252360 [Phlegmacium glaucopus]|nr:hypothetical protein BYT27DRAFT_7252360 [Phlegmacium glaucopus]
MPPLLQHLTERKPETLDYPAVSYGLTPQLLRFWKRAGYVPLYVRQTTSELTGEHTCVMVRGLNTSVVSELEWLREFPQTVPPFTYKFHEFGSVTALSILEVTNAGIKDGVGKKTKVSYINDFLVFQRRLGDEVRLTAVQSSILLGLGLQRKTIEDVEAELYLPVLQTLALFVKIVRKIPNRLIDIRKAAISAQIPEASLTVLDKLPLRCDQDKNVPAREAAADVGFTGPEKSLAEAEAQVSNNLKCGNGSSGLKGVSTVVSRAKATTATAATAGQKRHLEKLEESMDSGGKDKKKPTRGNSKKAED